MAEQPTNIIVETGGSEGGSRKALSAVLNFLTHQKLGRFLLACLMAFIVYIVSQRMIKFVWPLSLFWTVLIFALVILGVSFGANSVILILSVIGLPILFILFGSTLPSFSPLLKLSPIIMVVIVLFWIAFVFVATQGAYQNKKSPIPLLLVLLNIAMYCFLMLPVTSQILFAGFQVDAPIRNAVVDQQNEWSVIWEKTFTGFESAKMEAQRQVKIATGNYEAGVEAQSQKPLGIFLENMGTNSPVRLSGSTDPKVEIFGYIKAVTQNPKDKFKVSASCYPLRDSSLKTVATFNPDDGGYLFANDYKSVDCKMPASVVSVGEGTSKVVFETSFDFNTSAFLKTYFMEQDVIRSYRMQNLDPLDEYKIVDKNPVAVYTGGPLMIGMRVSAQQPVPLVVGSDVGPSLDITLDRTAQWPEGELMKINELVIYLPVGLSLANANVLKEPCSTDGVSQRCVLSQEELKKWNLEPTTDKPVILPARLRFETKLDSDGVQKLLGGAPLSVNSFKLDASYTFRIKKTFDIKVDK